MSIKHEWLYRTIYMRTIIDNVPVQNRSKHANAINLRLEGLERKFARNNYETYKKVLTMAKNVWNVTKEKHEHYMVDTEPVVVAFYYGAKVQFAKQKFKPRLIDALMNQYFTEDNGEYEVRGYNLVKEIMARTEQMIKERDESTGAETTN